MVMVVKNLPTNAGDMGDAGWIPGLGRSPRGGRGNPLQYPCLENPRDTETWGVTVHRFAKSRTWLKRLSMHACTTVSGWPASILDARACLLQGFVLSEGVLLDPWGLRGGEITLNAVLGTRRCSAVPVCEQMGKERLNPAPGCRATQIWVCTRISCLNSEPPWRSDSASLTSSQGMLRWLVQGPHVRFCPGTSNTWILF